MKIASAVVYYLYTITNDKMWDGINIFFNFTWPTNIEDFDPANPVKSTNSNSCDCIR